MSKLLKIVTITVTIAFSSNILAFAETSSAIQDRINENQNQIDNLENEKNKINDEINQQTNELKSILDQINEKSNDLQQAREEVNSYQVKIDEVQKEIDSINNEINNSQNEIQSREIVIEQKENEAIEIKANIDKRLRSYYKIDMVTNYIYLILKSEDLLSLFNNIQGIFRIINFDKDLFNEAKEVQAQLEIEKEELSKELEKIEENKVQVVAKQDELKEAQSEFIAKEEYHESKMNELKELENQKTDLIASLADEENDLESQIGDLISYNQSLQQELDNIFSNINSGNNSSGGGSISSGESGGSSSGSTGDPNTETFLRPGSGIITDDYGPRINPVTGEAGFHAGVDLGDPYGAPVYASKSGVIVYSDWISGYGNTIIIDHGSGVQTLYAHNSELLVSVGTYVSRGQTIAYVGSTGMSTGPHIHWEIRVNGQHIDPMPYV